MRRPTVLVIEESRLLRDRLVRWLRRDFRVRACDSAQAAIEALDRRPADWLILNPLIAPNSGFELLYELNSHPDLRRARTILLTSGPCFWSQHQSALTCLNVAGVMTWAGLNRQLLRQFLVAGRHRGGRRWL